MESAQDQQSMFWSEELIDHVSVTVALGGGSPCWGQIFDLNGDVVKVFYS